MLVRPRPAPSREALPRPALSRTALSGAALLGTVLLLSACGGADRSDGEVPGGTGAAGCPAQVEVRDAVPVVAPAEPELPMTVQSARLCRYDAGGALTADERLEPAGLGERLLLPRAFPGQAPACAPDPAALPLLLALELPDGRLQVGTAADPAGCAPTRLGARESAVHLGDPTVTAPRDDEQRCGPGTPGRAGQEGALVPAGATGVVLCRVDGRGVTRRTGSPADLALVEQVLGEPVAAPSGGTAAPCTPRVQGEVLLTWPSGPPVLVRLRPGCTPSVDNGSLAADPAPAAVDALLALLPG